MIRINLLGHQRRSTRTMVSFDVGQQVTLLCSLVLVAAAIGIGWWYWTLEEASTQVDIEIAAAQQEQLQLRSIVAEVARFQARRAQLQQRVALIDRLRSGQSVPVQLLDHVSRSMPDALWLTGLEQKGDAVTIQGQSMTLISLSDFVGNLGSSPLLKKPIELVNSQVQATPREQGQAPVEVIQFTVRAQLINPQAIAAPPPVPAPGTPGATQ